MRGLLAIAGGVRPIVLSELQQVLPIAVRVVALDPSRRRVVARGRRKPAVAPRPVARQHTAAMALRVAAGGELGVGGALIRIGALLIAATRRLIGIRPRLILITDPPVMIPSVLLLPARPRVAILCAAIATLRCSIT